MKTGTVVKFPAESVKSIKVKPILFNTEMVHAILQGRKMVTRRLVKPAPAGDGSKPEELTITRPGYWNQFGDDFVYRQPYKPGDIMYVRETWQYAYDLNGNDQIIECTGRFLYAADNPAPFNDWIMPDGTHRDRMPWRPSIHMPKEAARIFLRVTDVRVEKLQDITEEQARKEGAEPAFEYNTLEGPEIVSDEDGYYVLGFKGIWDSTIKLADRDQYGFDANPWVWVIEFERISKEDALHE